MKKLTTLAATLLILCLVLTACSQNKQNSSEPVTTPAPAESTTSETKLNYPEKPVQMIVSWAAGGANDITARILTEGFQLVSGVANPITKVPGGGGEIGFGEILAADHDGYTVGLFSMPNIVTTTLDHEAIYKLEDFTFVIGVYEDARAVCVAGNSPYNSISDLADALKKDSSSVIFTNGGFGTAMHYASLDLANKIGVEATHMPFDGTNQCIISVMSGESTVVMPNVGECASYIKDGSLKCIGVMAGNRVEAMPDVPTVLEQGYDCVHTVVRGVMVPSDVDPAIIKYLHDTYKAAIELPEIQKKFADAGNYVKYYSTEEMQELINKTKATYSELIAILNK